MFLEIGQTIPSCVGKIFLRAKDEMLRSSANQAWENAVENTENNLKNDDRQVIKMLAKLLGQTDVEGQINQINITNSFVEKQLENAELEKEKNEKLFKKLIPTIALVIIVILF